MACASTKRCCGCCTIHGWVKAVLLLSALPLAAIVALERAAATNRSNFRYRSRGWLRECAVWDDVHNRFLVSTMLDGGVAAVEVSQAAEEELEEREVVRDGDVAGNASLGIAVDRRRGRLLVVYADVVRRRYGAVAAYDYVTWQRIFLTELNGSGDEESLADDVTVDDGGNAYITDAKTNKIWKVDIEGQLKSTIQTPVFRPREEWYYNLVGLNGVVYHPDGYLLVIHTATGVLFNVDVATEEVEVVEVADGSLVTGDGLALLSPRELVVAGMASVKVVESSDGWKTARVRGKCVGPVHRVATAATVKDGKAYVSHLIGGWLLRRKHVITEAVFTPLSMKS